VVSWDAGGAFAGDGEVGEGVMRWCVGGWVGG